MKRLIIALMVLLLCASCFGGVADKEVVFEWFNLSTNHIWVTDVVGIPTEASPGRLIPNHAEDQLESSASHFLESVRIKDRIKIVWKDGGAKGWPGGLRVPGSVPPGVKHEVELKRDDLGLPAKLIKGTVRFTYLGHDKWRVRLITIQASK